MNTALGICLLILSWVSLNTFKKGIEEYPYMWNPMALILGIFLGVIGIFSLVYGILPALSLIR